MSVSGTESTTRTGRGWLTGALLLVHVPLTALSFFYVVVLAMRSAGCDTQCDFEAAGATLSGSRVTLVAILLLTIAALAVRAKKWATNWPIPLIGIVLTILTLIVAGQLFIAYLPSLPASSG